MSDADDIPVPSYDKILEAANDLNEQEELALRYRQYSSSRERFWFYDNKDAAHQAVKEACEKGKAAEAGASEQQLNDPQYSTYAYKTLRMFVTFSIGQIRNAELRSEYVIEIAKWAHTYKGALASDAQLAAERAVAMRNTIRQAFHAKKAPTSQAWANMMKSKGHDFAAILDMAKNKLYPGRTLKSLSIAEKANVFDEIINSAGRGSFTSNLLGKVATAVGWAVVVATLGLLVYDIVQGATDFVGAVSDILSTGASFVAGWVASGAASALALQLFGEAATFTIFVFGTLGGVLAGTVVGALVGALLAGFVAIFDAVFSNPYRAMWDKYLSAPMVYRVKLPVVIIDI